MFYGFGSPYDNSGLIAIDDIKFIERPPSISSTKFFSSLGPTTSYTTNNLLLTDEKTTENRKSSELTRRYQTTREVVSSSFMPTSGTTANINNQCFGSTEIPDGTDFSPCNCEWEGEGEPYVSCNQVNMTEVRDGLFTRLDRIFFWFPGAGIVEW